MLNYILFGVAFVWIVAATFVDIKKREVPDWLSYSLIGFGFGARGIYALIYSDYINLGLSVLYFLIATLFALFMYYTKQWGGGDSKLLMGLGIIIGNIKFEFLNYQIPFLLLIIFSIFLFGGVYSLIYSVVLAIIHRNNFLKEFRKIKVRYFISIFILGLILFLVSLFLPRSVKIFGIFLSLIFVFLSYLILFVKAVENSCMYKFTDTSKLVPGDWLAEDVIVKKKVICSSKKIGLDENDIKLLKKFKIRKVLVKEGIPFVPGFLMGFVFAVIYSRILF